MNAPQTPEPVHADGPATMAPADQRARARWPLWRVIAAYALMSVLAAVSIWYIDRGYLRSLSPAQTTTTQPAR